MKILVVSLTPTHPANAGNRARILEMCRALKGAGHDLHFVFSPREEGDAQAMAAYFGQSRFHSVPYARPRVETSLFSRVARKVGRRLGWEWAYLFDIDDWYPRNLPEFLEGLARDIDFDMVLVEYIFMTAAFRHFPGALKVCDTHDRFADRHRIYLQAGRKPNWFSTTRDGESRAIARADAVIAIQEAERKYFAEDLGHRLVVRIGHLFPILEGPRKDPQNANLLFVASDNVINVDGIRCFIDHVLPAVLQGRPDARLILAGTICRAIADTHGVRKLYFVPDLSEAYADAAVVINPVQYGTGLNIKTIEALGTGVPLVCTEAGSRGFEEHRNLAFASVGDKDYKSMSTVVLELLESQQTRARFSQQGLTLARQWNTQQVQALSDLVGARIPSSDGSAP